MSMATDARIGSELAGYRIEAPIGRGGMGVVYRAEQLRLGRKVALKLLAPELAENQGFRARFEHESRLAAALDHPNIVPLFEAGEADGLLFITMRYVEGTDLRALLSATAGSSPSARWRSPARSAARSTPPTCAASSTATSSPATSSSPSDAAADLPEHCYLTDFGLTKDTSSPVELTATGHLRRHHRLHRARADRGRQARRSRRPVRARLRPLRVPDRPSALPARRGDQRDVGAPAGRAARRHRRPPGPARRDRRRHRPGDGQGPRQRFATCTAMVAAARDALLPGAVGTQRPGLR